MARMVPAVQRAFGILELFSDDREELTSREITDELQLPRTTVHELVNTLLSLGYLKASSTHSGSFRLGVKVVGLGLSYTDRLDLAVEGRQIAERITAECAETVHLAVLDGRVVVYLVKIDSTRAIRMVSGQGRRVPAHCTAVGKMLLAQLSDQAIDELYAGAPLERLTPTSIGTVPALKDALEQIRRVGLAYDREESTPGLSCVSAPVHDHTKGVVAAMSISVPSTRWDDRGDEGWAKLVQKGAAELSHQLGMRD